VTEIQAATRDAVLAIDTLDASVSTFVAGLPAAAASADAGHSPGRPVACGSGGLTDPAFDG
jgi:hypothetical protein